MHQGKDHKLEPSPGKIFFTANWISYAYCKGATKFFNPIHIYLRVRPHIPSLFLQKQLKLTLIKNASQGKEAVLVGMEKVNINMQSWTTTLLLDNHQHHHLLILSTLHQLFSIHTYDIQLYGSYKVITIVLYLDSS